MRFAAGGIDSGGDNTRVLPTYLFWETREGVTDIECHCSAKDSGNSLVISIFPSAWPTFRRTAPSTIPSTIGSFAT